MKLVFSHQTFSYELLRTIAYAPYGGADIGECLATAGRIRENDVESWYREWLRTAQRIHAAADESLSTGCNVSAREALLRASNYYRTAEFFLPHDPDDARRLMTWRAGRECFARAATLLASPVEPVEIRYEGTTPPGYFYRVDDAGECRPALIFHGGFDSTVEELYFAGVVAALRRGYNCLTFDGPGQGRVIREQRLPFRHESQQLRLPAHKYRRLHLNLPGAPEGAAYQPESVMDAIERGAGRRPYVPGVKFVAFCDHSHGSNDDATVSATRTRARTSWTS